ncbi:MAG: hypothetical protein ACODAA_00840 [Gemmatimonadota bacterium]
MTAPTLSRHDRRIYHAMLARAAYYRWSALRGHTLPGGDPVTGRPRSNCGALHRRESRAAYLAMARHWLARARSFRLETTR